MTAIDSPEAIKFSRIWAMPNANTFEIRPIFDFVRRYVSNASVIVDPFARDSKIATYTNDLNPETAAEYHMEALDFLDMVVAQGVKADLVIFDPPYSPRQVKEVYEKCGRHFGIKDQWNTGRWTAERRTIAGMMCPRGVVLSFGWNTQGMGLQHGYAIEEVCLICHGGAHNDTICMAERKTATLWDHMETEATDG